MEMSKLVSFIQIDISIRSHIIYGCINIDRIAFDSADDSGIALDLALLTRHRETHKGRKRERANEREIERERKEEGKEERAR